MRKIAILGSAESTRDLAPFDDASWEIWGLAWRYQDHPRMDRCFEVHAEWMWSLYANDLYKAWLQNPTTLGGEDSKQVPVYLQPEEAKRYKGCKAYPIDAAIKLMGGRGYFTSSFSYMLAAAILEEPEELGVWGIDLVAGEEYADQRPCAEFLLGVAHAKGIKLTIPPQSALLRNPWVYGREASPAQNPMWTRYKQKAEEYRTKIDDLKTQIFTLTGAKHECEEFAAAIEAQSRGALGGGR